MPDPLEPLMSASPATPSPQQDPRPGWTSPLPDRLPRPTYAPATMALGIIFVLWGFVTTWVLSLVGAGLFTVAIALWIKEVRRAG